MTSTEALDYLKTQDRHITTLGNIASVLSWDFETVMPKKAAEGRVEQFSLMANLIHEAQTDPRIQEAVESIETEGLTDAEKTLVKNWKKTVKESLATPLSLVTALSEAEGKAHGAWLEAREKNDFSIFLPSLTRLVDLKKEEAKCIGDGTYDTLLDRFEEGMTREKVSGLFDELEVSIHGLMDKLSGVEVDSSFLTQSYDPSLLNAFCMRVIDDMGFDRERGTVGIVAHPFTINLGRDDIRISNRFSDPSILDPICSITHETGHALYEMYAALNPEIRGTSLSGGVSMGIHESQSRFWENLMGRSFAFWEHYYPLLQSYIPTLKEVSLESFVKAANKTEPSAIRVNADELTYSLHIILRYRIEKALFEGTLSPRDVPEAWNKASKETIRYTVKADGEGCLQDSHWSNGQFGYFPTYALGNLYSAMFLEALYRDCGGKTAVDAALREGNLSLITDWQRKNIWQYGSIYAPSELLLRTTGKTLSSDSFESYLEEKFTTLYL
ncbi:MAG: carboxypeptidase M32 [Spirochaetales bacterium]|nr:carboxypeptidase M32 [Candidatus Physcosoma equi]